MLSDGFQIDLIIFFIGIVIGITITRYYYEKTKNYSIGKTIQGAMISDSVNHLIELHNELSSSLSKIQEESMNLNEQIMRSGDIESIPLKELSEESGDKVLPLDFKSIEDNENYNN